MYREFFLTAALPMMAAAAATSFFNSQVIGNKNYFISINTSRVLLKKE